MLLFISARGSDAIAARLPPSSRAGRRGDKEKMCFSAIETLSREISRHSAARTIEDCDFSTPLPTVEMTIGRLYHSKSVIPVRPFPMPMDG